MPMIKLKDLQTNLFVRRALNHDHVLFLAELIENGVKLPPIKITREGTVVDGRHRIEAHELNNLDEIAFDYEDADSEIELIAKAYQSNIGGSLPPTPQDTEHTVMLLLERGEAMKRIGDLLGLPAGMARRYVAEVKSKTARAKLQRAVAAVTDGGLTVTRAAEQYDVDHGKLKEALSGRKREVKWGIAEVQRNLTKSYRSAAQKNAALIRGLLEKYEDGDVTSRQVRDIIRHIEQLQKRANRSILDWEKRFDALNGSGKK